MSLEINIFFWGLHCPCTDLRFPSHGLGRGKSTKRVFKRVVRTRREEDRRERKGPIKHRPQGRVEKTSNHTKSSRKDDPIQWCSTRYTKFTLEGFRNQIKEQKKVTDTDTSTRSRPFFQQFSDDRGDHVNNERDRTKYKLPCDVKERRGSSRGERQAIIRRGPPTSLHHHQKTGRVELHKD